MARKLKNPEHPKRYSGSYTICSYTQHIFFHPDYTVGSGISPDRQQTVARGLYRRWGIAPRPEDFFSVLRSLYTIVRHYTSLFFNINCHCNGSICILGTSLNDTFPIFKIVKTCCSNHTCLKLIPLF